MQRFAGRCFFTWSLEDTSAVTASYARQQIDACDYVFFLIGGRYGNLSASGVSYLHLDFIYANTKKKPMMVMLHANPELDHESSEQGKANFNRRKLEDFRNQILRDSNKLHRFGSNIEFANKSLEAYEQLCVDYPASGWLPAKASDQNVLGAPSNADSGDKTENETDYEHLAVNRPKVNLNDSCTFSYRVHTFEGGNFTEMMLKRTMAWGDVLSTVAGNLKMPASEEVFTKSLHDYLDKTALKDAKKVKPDAHATARSQIVSKDLSEIKIQFFVNDWIKTTQKPGSKKMQLMLTPQGARQAAQWQSVMARMKV